MSRLCWAINSRTGIARLPLGNYTFENRKVFCYLNFKTILLPEDPPHCGPQGESDMTYLKCEPDNNALPKAFHQIGQLCLSSTTNSARAQPSCFVVVVTPVRKVFAIWNPIGPDPEYNNGSDDDDDESFSTTYKTRRTSGKLLGFNTPCAAFVLTDNINNLCHPQQIDKALDISEKQFIILAAGTTLRFTGVAVA